MAVREGTMGLAAADSGRSPKHVAPFGGREARLGTNPISIAVPSDLEAPFYLDMATSAVAAGKIQLAAARGKEIPTGWIVDSGGRQTTDPTQFRKGGALLPLGGTEGYKGSGLAAMVEVLCGLLTGLGFGVEPTGRHNDGCFMAVVNVSARGKEIPTGWIVDSGGRQTTDPTQFRKGGALLPLGGTEGYKGSGLAAMVEVLCGLLTGLGFGVEPTGRHNDGCFMAVFNVAAFRPLKDFKKEVAEFARYLKATPPSEGSAGVFYPGEVEYLREQQRKLSGIEVEDATWEKLRALADAYKLAADLDLK